MPRRRRRSMFSSAPPRRSAGVPWLEPGLRARGHRRYRRQRNPMAYLIPLLVLVAVGGAITLYVRHQQELDRQRNAAERYLKAWAARDARGMYDALDDRSQKAYSFERFQTLQRRADRAATVRGVTVGRPSDPDDGKVAVPVTITTRYFGSLRGRVRLPVDGANGVRWSPRLRLPGLHTGEAPRRTTLQSAHQATVLTGDGRRLADDPLLSPFAPGLERRYADRINGRPGAELRYGDRLIRRVAPRPGRSVRSTLRRSVQAAAERALGSKLGGVAVIRPRDGSVLALAGIAVSAPQPPGSTFKIITLAGALAAGIASPSSSYPVRTSATLSGVRLANAGNESCGGSLAQSFAHSCNSVFAPLGARLGAQRLLARARAFGFEEAPRVPAAKRSTLGGRATLKDAIAIGSAAIGQNKAQATPLQMASVAAAIGARGMRAQPRVVRSDPVIRRRAVSAKVAAQVRDMMVAVVRSGTGTAAAIDGVEVAGKTGTAELRFTGTGAADPKNTDAWFVAFAPARNPRVAVGVMLVGAGAGGKAAAPIARRVLAAAL